MDWPPQSLDLNITGAMWDHFDREPNKRKPTSLNVLQKAREVSLKTTERN